MTWANSTGETVDQADVALGYVYGPVGNQLTGSNDTITITDPTMTPANWSGSFGMEQPAPTAVAIGVAIPGIGVGVGNVADCPYLADAWADSLAPLVDPSEVAAGYQYGPINRPVFGTNEGITSDDPPVVPESWMGTFCGLLPAPSAVAEGVVISGVGVGTAEVAAVTTDIPCDLEPKKLYASCGQIKTHRIVPVNEDGAAIDVQGVPLTFVIEDQEGYDLETGTATQNPPVGDPLLGADDVGSEIMFTSQAANDMPGEYRFAVRDTATNSPVCFGELIVRYVPKIGDPMPTTDAPDCPSKFSVCLQGNGGKPIRGAIVFASTDQAGLEIEDVTISDQAGNAEFIRLKIGTYYATTKINGQTIDVRPFEVKN